MAFITTNGYDVEHASSMYVYENLMGEVQHINGQGVTDTYTMRDDINNVFSIDVMRILPLPPMFRQLGARNNGAWHNKQNEGGFNNASQSEHYTIGIDLIYDRNVPIMATQEFSNPINLQRHVQTGIVASIGLSINVVTHAKQIEGYFRDSFTKGDAQVDEIADAVFAGNKALAANEEGSYPDAFLSANAKINEGIPELGAFVVPVEERQGFVSNTFNRIAKRQYMQNASEASARILASGYMNPFNNTESKRIKSTTGLCGQYDGIDLYIVNDVIKRFVYVALGLNLLTDSQIIASLNKIQAEVCYAGATLRGIVGPSIEVNKHPFGKGVIVCPLLKMGVEVISGKGIKMVVDGGWTAEEINNITNKIEFTPIDGVTVKGENAFAEGVFNDGTSN